MLQHTRNRLFAQYATMRPPLFARKNHPLPPTDRSSAHGQPVSFACLPGSDLILQSIRYEGGDLEVLLQSPALEIQVCFSSVIGFRLLDEGDLLEFWQYCHQGHGWLFQISQNGWLQQESQRLGFVSQHNSNQLKEFLISGLFDCINVLSYQQPKLLHSRRRQVTDT